MLGSHWSTPGGRQPRFIVGANLPWIDYGADFGASRWHPEGGLSIRPSALAKLEQALATLERDRVSFIRVFMVCDGRSGVAFDDDGLPTGVDESFFPDADALLASARQRGVRVMWTLLDFHLCGPLRMVNGVQLGGRAHLIATPAGGAALIDRVIGPILERYRDDPTVAAWDVINEPEWCGLPLDTMREFLRLVVGRVRGTTSQPVTVGCARLDGLDLVRGLGLDFYQVHWYRRFGWRALERPVADLGLDRPVILGEFPGRGGRGRVADVLDAAERAGYAGAFVWSLLADDRQSGYSADVAEWIRARTPDRA